LNSDLIKGTAGNLFPLNGWDGPVMEMGDRGDVGSNGGKLRPEICTRFAQIGSFVCKSLHHLASRCQFWYKEALLNGLILLFFLLFPTF
jgi:hypothetical protein